MMPVKCLIIICTVHCTNPQIASTNSPIAAGKNRNYSKYDAVASIVAYSRINFKIIK